MWLLKSVLISCCLTLIFVNKSLGVYIEVHRPNGSLVDTTNNYSDDKYTGYENIQAYLGQIKPTSPAFPFYAKFKENKNFENIDCTHYWFPIDTEWSLMCKHLADSGGHRNNVIGNMLEKYICPFMPELSNPNKKVELDLVLLRDPCYKAKIFKPYYGPVANKEFFIPFYALHSYNATDNSVNSYSGNSIEPAIIGIAKSDVNQTNELFADLKFLHLCDPNYKIKLRTGSGDSGAPVFVSTEKNTGNLAEDYMLAGIGHAPANEQMVTTLISNPTVNQWINYVNLGNLLEKDLKPDEEFELARNHIKLSCYYKDMESSPTSSKCTLIDTEWVMGFGPHIDKSKLKEIVAVHPSSLMKEVVPINIDKIIRITKNGVGALFLGHLSKPVHFPIPGVMRFRGQEDVSSRFLMLSSRQGAPSYYPTKLPQNQFLLEQGPLNYKFGIVRLTQKSDQLESSFEFTNNPLEPKFDELDSNRMQGNPLFPIHKVGNWDYYHQIGGVAIGQDDGTIKAILFDIDHNSFTDKEILADVLKK